MWAASADSRYFPPPLTIFAEFQDLWLFSQFGTHVVPSLERILLGFGIGSAFGIVLGIPLGLSAWSHRFAMPHIEYWRAMPPPALLPISVILLHSIGNLQKVSLIAFFCFFPVLLNTMEGVRGIDPTLMETARAYGVPAREQIRRIVFPAALPRISAGMRTERLAGGHHHGHQRVLLEHERRRLRAADLEEHVPAHDRCGRRSC